MSTPGRRGAAARPPFLVELFHHRWAVPALDELGEGRVGGRFAPLARRLGVGREVLRKTLAALVALGLVRRHPGYGHPLRPEYTLTPPGRDVAGWAARFRRAARRAGAEGAARHKWSMPVLHAVRRGAHRFGEMESALPHISARALALALRELEGAGLVLREVIDERPPSVHYRPTAEGRRIGSLLDEAPHPPPPRERHS